MNACVLSFTLIISIGFCRGDEFSSVNLRYYMGSFENYAEIPILKAQDIFSLTWYNSSKDTIIFAHGFTGRPTGPAVTAVVTALLDRREYNVALLNWQELAAPILSNIANSYLRWAAPNSRKLGVYFASILKNLFKSGLNLNRTRLVGHSLGAHIFGITGNVLLEEGVQLPWITGLDPASINFENKPVSQRLNPSSAAYVDVIHSDPSKYGYKVAIGTVDFWPNFRPRGHVRQPGCKSGPHQMFSADDICSHNRCWQLLVDSIEYPGSVIGSYAKNYRQWKNYSNNQKKQIVLEMGKYPAKIIPGNYFLITNSESPYGLGLNGL